VNSIWAAAARERDYEVEQTMDKTDRSLNKRKVAVLLMMETSKAYSQCEQHLGCGCDMETRPNNGNKTGGSKNERRVASLSMMETSTSMGDIDSTTWQQDRTTAKRPAGPLRSGRWLSCR
jgi:hypothetical protein